MLTTFEQIREALYPRSEADFKGKQLSRGAAADLKEAAANGLLVLEERASRGLHDLVSERTKAHWKSIAAGQLPFGMTVA